MPPRQTAFGLTTRARAIGRRSCATSAEIDRTRVFSVLCIRQPVETCLAQVPEIVARSRLRDAVKVSAEADLLTITR